MKDYAAKDFLHPIRAKIRLIIEATLVLGVLGAAYLYAEHTDEQIKKLEAERNASALCVPIKRGEVVSMGWRGDVIECVIHSGKPGNRVTTIPRARGPASAGLLCMVQRYQKKILGNLNETNNSMVG